MADKARRAAVVALILADRAKGKPIDYAKWAEEEGIPVGTLKSAVSRATAKLQPGATCNPDATREADLPVVPTKPGKVANDFQGLTPQQIKALGMVMRGSSHRKAAAAVGVHHDTVSTWARLPAWRVAWELERANVAAEHRMATESYRGALVEGGEAATTFLVEVFDDDAAPASAKVQAADQILSRIGLPKGEQLQVTGPDGGPMEVFHSFTEETLAAIEAMPTALLAGYLAGRWPRWRQILVDAGEEIEDAEVIDDQA